MSLEKSKDGFIWAATNQGALVQIDEATLLGWQLNLPHVVRVFVDSRDRVWASTDHGLFLNESRHGRAKIRLADGAASGSRTIEDMAEDSKGRIWAISSEYLLRFDAPNWTRVDISMAKLGHHMEDLAIDKSDGLWINGNGGGIVRFQLRTVKCHNGEVLCFYARRAITNFLSPVAIDVVQRIRRIHIALFGVVAFGIDQAPRPASGKAESGRQA